MQLQDLDAIDQAIVRLLSTDGRMSYSDIAKQVGVSRTSVKARIVELERRGIILGYRAIILTTHPKNLVQFVINLDVELSHFESVKAKLRDLPEVVAILNTTGNQHLVLICETDSVAASQQLVRSIYRIEGLINANAHTVLEVVKGKKLFY